MSVSVGKTEVTGNIFLVPRHISKIRECQVISSLSTQNGMLKVKTFFFLKLLVSCLLINENESRKL